MTRSKAYLTATSQRLIGILPLLRYQLYAIQTAEEALASGNLFFIDLHANASPICFHDNSIVLFYSKIYSPEWLYQHALQRYQGNVHKSEELLAVAKWSLEKRYWQTAADALYKAIHVLFCQFEENFNGERTVGEGLIARQELLAVRTDAFFKIFDPESKRDMRLASPLRQNFRDFMDGVKPIGRQALQGLLLQTEDLRRSAVLICEENLRRIESVDKKE